MIFEIEYDHNGRNLFFLPLQRTVRGRLDFGKCGKAAFDLREQFGEIPGQRIGIDLATGDAWIAEPLHDAKHRILREKIEQRAKLEPEREEFKGQDVATFVYWMKRALESGQAKVTDGTEPDKVKGEPRTRFFDHDRKRVDKQQQKIDALIELVTKLTGKKTAV